MRTSTSSQFLKKHPHKTYAHHLSEHPQNMQQKNLAAPAFKKINSITFSQDSMIISSKQQLVIYSLFTMQPFYIKNGYFWDSTFIPNTFHLLTVQHDGTQKSRRMVKIIDLRADQVLAQVVIKFQIQSIKATQKCICLVGQYQLCVMHYPSLGPICHQLAGTGLQVLYDVSYQGLTLAYNNQKKGVVIVHNFSSITTTKARRKSFQSAQKKSMINSFYFQSQPQPKKIVQIKAHLEFINLIRLSPNGNRLATSSQKGTMIRIFLTETGKIYQQLRLGYQISKILDMNFYEEGNVIACINEKSLVFLFNTKLDNNEEMEQNQKRGYKIYQQENPKSMFGFLKLFYRNFGNQYPFANFKLVKPQEDKKDKKDEKPKQPQKKQQKYMQVILQQTTQNLQNSQFNIPAQQPLPQQQPPKPVKHLQSLPQPQPLPEQVQQKDQPPLRMARSDSVLSSLLDVKSKRSQSLMKKINALQGKREDYVYVAPIFNTFCKICVGGNNFIWVVKGPYLFSLKYDPFNGGEMYKKDVIKFY